MKSEFKYLPSVSEILEKVKNVDKVHKKYLTRLTRDEIKRFRDLARKSGLKHSRTELVQIIVSKIDRILRGNVRKVINGTGIVLHTGFGRAPLSREILNETTEILDGYVNLELDISSGKRGDRNSLVEKHLSAISFTESSCIVNNNAAAVMLTINTFARDKEVIVSRGQLVEIGGSFRIPDIIDRSSGILNEVGSTNRTHLRDYEAAINENTGLILWVHTSNYRLDGFTKEVPLTDLVSLGKRGKIPVMADLGSGVLMKSGFESNSEETVEQVAKTGVDFVTYSGDKLLGGPQSGIITGKKKYINLLKQNSMYRALRCDKFSVTLLERSLMTYGRDSVAEKNLTHLLLQRNRNSLMAIGKSIMDKIGPDDSKKLGLKLVESLVEAGSGSMPVETIESVALHVNVPETNPSQLSKMFRACETPIVGYIKGNKFYIDLKALIPGEEKLLTTGLKEAAAKL